MKRTICILLSIGIMLLSSCAPRATVDELPNENEQAVLTETATPTDASTTSKPTPTVKPTAKPTATIVPTPTPEPEDGEKYDVKRERVRCRVDNLQLDMKETWKVNSPTESPDPSWVVESVEGDTVTYSKTDCEHLKKISTDVPCPINPGAQELDKIEYISMTEAYAADFDTRDGYWTLFSNEDGIVTYVSPQQCSENHSISYMFELVPCKKSNAKGNDFDQQCFAEVLVTAENKPDVNDGWVLFYVEDGIETYRKIVCDH